MVHIKVDAEIVLIKAGQMKRADMETGLAYASLGGLYVGEE